MLSIDITDRQIKLVRGAHAGSKIRVLDADMRELSAGMVSNGYITDVPMIAAELNNIIKTKDIKEKECVVSITSSAIVYKELSIAKPKNMKNPAIIEAMIQSTMNISTDFNISFTIAGETEDDEGNKMLTVMAAACPQRLVDGYVRLFSQIGLSLKGVYISNNSITRLIKNTPKMAGRMPLLLIQIDKNFINMNLYEDNQLAFSRFSTIDPSQFEVEEGEDINYVSHAVYDNLFGMMNFISGRKNSKPLQEIIFYGEIESYVEITNAISSFGIPTNTFSEPDTIQKGPSVQYDFSKFANAIGALYTRNKELEHINLLEATSAKESKGSAGFGLSVLAALVLAAGAVGGGMAVCGMIDGNLNKQINDYSVKIQDPQLQKDLKTVDDRDSMLTGFTNYNNTIQRTSLLFNYHPKVISQVYSKLAEPLTADGLLDKDEDLQILSYEASGDTVTAIFIGTSKKDPAAIPSKYADMLTNNVKNKYDEPYFVNVGYSGFMKEVLINDELGHDVINGEEELDTIFSFTMTMQLQMGNDEEHTDSSKDFEGVEAPAQPTEEGEGEGTEGGEEASAS